jgi:hypothetical protein
MKANRRTLPCLALAACAALSALLGACMAPVQAPGPAPLPARPLPPPLSRPTAPTDWHDLPATPGVWQWRREGRLSIARFGESQAPALLSLSCDPQAGTITLSRSGATGTATTMSILTASLSRKFATRPGGDGAIAAPIAVILAARDPLLDAMAFSRGRFAVEVPGLAALYLPSWPEVSRVIEDCR